MPRKAASSNSSVPAATATPEIATAAVPSAPHTTPRGKSRPLPQFDSLEQEAFLHLWRTCDRLKIIEEDLFSQFDLTAQQYNTLRLLQSAAPGSLPTLVLGRRLISRAPDMTRLLDRLEERGYLRRERRPENRRVVEVAITDAGRQLLCEIHAAVVDCHRRQLGHLDARALRQLIDLLKQARAPHEDLAEPSFVDA